MAPGQIVSIPLAAHGCEGFPEAAAYPAGTVWKCLECGQEWVCVKGAQYNEPYSAWRRITESNMFGEDV